MTATSSYRSAIEDVLSNLSSVFPAPRDRVQQILNLLAKLGYDPATASVSPSMFADVMAYFRRMLLAYMGLATAAIDFASSDEAALLAEQVDAPLRAEVQYSGDNYDQPCFDGIVAIRTAILNDIQSRGSNLPYLLAYTTPSALPACVIAYMAYGDGSRGDEIVLRNNPVHPLFCATSNEILSR